MEAPADVAAVARELGFAPSAIAAMEEAAARHRFRTTRYYLSLVDRDDPADPILAQLLPDARELDPSPPGYVHDAVGDLVDAHHPAPGLVHKYAGRALLVTTSACAVYCRFCFRRAFPYEELKDGGRRMERARQVIAADPSITEVILSGGDPLSWTDRALERLVTDLAAIPHVQRLRVHSRAPVVLPSRVTPALVAALTGTRLQTWFVTHFNHPRELTVEATGACARLREAGIPVLNQAVLLRGVNDCADTLAALCEGLVNAGLKPYYLHQLDRVHGTAHFEVPEHEGRRLVDELRGRVSGIAMPTWVRDVAGAASKVPLLLLLGLMLGCGGGEPTPERVEHSLSGLSAGDGDGAGPEVTPAAASDAIAEQPPELPEVPETPTPPLPVAERVLVADLFGDGEPEVFIGDGGDIRWGSWPTDAPQPNFSGRHIGKGMLQAWMAEDLDGDGDEEVVMAFGLGRGFPEAKVEIVVVNDFSKGTVARPIWRSDGERNQVTALAPWRKPGGGADIYVGHFATRFEVQGGVLSAEGGAPEWVPSHRIRMGMARAVGDFDGDGVSEVAIGRLYGEDANTPGDLRVIQEDGSVEMVPTLRGVRAVGVADLEGDGKAELLFGDGWHKNYGKLARYRPNVASRGADGTWAVATIDERSDNYAVEEIGAVGSAVVAGGNASLGVYQWKPDGGWQLLAPHQGVRATGSWDAYRDGRLVLSGPTVSRFRPGGQAAAKGP